MSRRGSGAVLVALLLSACSGSPAVTDSASRRLVYRVEDLTQGGHRITTQVVDIGSSQRARTVLHEGDSATGPAPAWVAAITIAAPRVGSKAAYPG